ncbi:RAMP superfamily CRISPR-associated protein [Rhodococcus pyridinivorans]|uniref:RAMP superfamily CRISPR-associated protein n=1 Tax=Rhodococcus pyridinivorans TaxID=103816 RepID=UPI0026587E17|nr:RAMP superfamily CRISPR-associated protein [Rhodococcus pyridinivorans]
MSNATPRWDLEITAKSPVVHRGEMSGTTALLRRMKIVQPDGTFELVPVVSGNSLRGVLRRIGEELLRDVLEYEGQLPLHVAHLLRNGGALAKSSAEPLTGRRLHEFRELVPHVSVFGGAVGSAPISGCLRVGHVLPLVAEAAPALRYEYEHELPSVFDVLSQESYSHADDPGPGLDTTLPPSSGSPLMRFEIEAFAPGTKFESWVLLDRGSELDHAFAADVLTEFTRRGWLGGRTATGHGQVSTYISPDPAADVTVDWRAVLAERRDDAMAALLGLP